MTVKVAVIGVGSMGKHHARVYSELKNVELVAVSDINKNLGKKIAEKYGCNFYSNYNEMLEKEKIDAISVVVPTKLHAKVAVDCINKNKHVLIEKPIASNLNEANHIIHVAKKKGIKLMVGHIERFNPAVRKIKEMINEGKFGNIISLISRRVGLFPPQIKDINVILDLAVHDIDVFNFILEKNPKAVFAVSGKALINNREDYADITLKYNGINAFIQVNWITPVKIRILNLTGTKGYGELNYIKQEVKFFKSVYKRIADNSFEEVIKFSTPIVKNIPINKEEPLKNELKSFISYINGGECLSSGDDALKAIKIAELAIQSCIKGKMIYL